MSTRCATAQMCVFFILICGYSGVTFAEKPGSKEAEDAAVAKAEKSKATAVTEIESEGEKPTEPALVVTYSSVFDDYVSFDDIPDIGWREANDNVGQIGGWRAYANIVQEEARKEAEEKAEMENQAMEEDK